ncbi:Ras guanine nucleotide exchange factor Q [Pelomyxa schiedti]|nr:Ras guanine nucleotide exchange factor Q [Pelomyxa schiedti]
MSSPPATTTSTTSTTSSSSTTKSPSTTTTNPGCCMNYVGGSGSCAGFSRAPKRNAVSFYVGSPERGSKLGAGSAAQGSVSCTKPTSRGNRALSEPAIPSWDFSMICSESKHIPNARSHSFPPCTQNEFPPPTSFTAFVDLLLKSPFNETLVDILLFTHPYYSSSIELLLLLINRYTTAHTSAKKDQIQQQVLNIMQRWAESHLSIIVIGQILLEFLELTVEPKHLQLKEACIAALKNNLVDTLWLRSQYQTMAPVCNILQPCDLEKVITMIWKASPLVRKRKKNVIISTKQAFIGNEIISYTQGHLSWLTRQQIVGIANCLLGKGVIKSYEKSLKVFVDGEVLYFFAKKHRSGGSDLSVTPDFTDISIFTDFSPEEFAQQLTLNESDIFLSIPLFEFYHQSWNSKTDSIIVTSSSVLRKSISHTNFISRWVTSEIVSTQNLRKRVSVLRRFIAIAQECKLMNNWSTMYAICLGLNAQAVMRLKKTWKQIPRREREFFENSTNSLLESNMKKYRNELAAAELPVIPYLAVFLKDLTFLEDGNPDMIDNGIINWKKIHGLADILARIQFYQSEKHKIKNRTPVQYYIINRAPAISSFEKLMSLSYTCESSQL